MATGQGGTTGRHASASMLCAVANLYSTRAVLAHVVAPCLVGLWHARSKRMAANKSSRNQQGQDHNDSGRSEPSGDPADPAGDIRLNPNN